MKANLKAPHKPLKANPSPRHKRRSRSLSIDKRKPSVHWISPAVFTAAETSNSNKDREPWTTDFLRLSQVFDPKTHPQPHPKRRCNKPRKHNEIPTSPEENTHKSKRVKQESKSNANPSSSADTQVVIEDRRRGQRKIPRLSYILNNDPYNVLEVSPSATRTVVKRAYKNKAVDLHPDKGGSEDEFIRLAAAYEILMDDTYLREFTQ